MLFNYTVNDALLASMESASNYNLVEKGVLSKDFSKFEYLTK